MPRARTRAVCFNGKGVFFWVTAIYAGHEMRNNVCNEPYESHAIPHLSGV
jgi:hypothetical protein